MPKTESRRQREQHVMGALLRLMFAARGLAWQAMHSRSGDPVPACPWCQQTVRPNTAAWLPGRHAMQCPLGAVTREIHELERIMSIAEMSARADRDAMLEEADAGLKKPPARVTELGAPAMAPLMAGLVDFGEPWRVTREAPGDVMNRAGEIMHEAWGSELAEDDDPAYARRIAAAMNLCAGAPTEKLEQAFDEIASTTPRWALLAIDVQNLGAGHMARIRDFIDETVKVASRPQPAGRPQ